MKLASKARYMHTSDKQQGQTLLIQDQGRHHLRKGAGLARSGETDSCEDLSSCSPPAWWWKPLRQRCRPEEGAAFSWPVAPALGRGDA